MKGKFNIIKNKIDLQFTDESVFSFHIVYNKSVLKFDRDIRSLKKWEFRIFHNKSSSFEEKTIEKFRNKFIKLF
jgi:hypothetical protein